MLIDFGIKLKRKKKCTVVIIDYWYYTQTTPPYKRRLGPCNISVYYTINDLYRV